jgi:hypothetical protein
MNSVCCEKVAVQYVWDHGNKSDLSFETYFKNICSIQYDFRYYLTHVEVLREIDLI